MPGPDPKNPASDSLSPVQPAGPTIYKTPGVYVEEVSSFPPAISGVSTSITAFVGASSQGPALSEALASFRDFTTLYGDTSDLHFSDAPSATRNYLAFATQAFFENGGQRLYIARASATDGSDRAPTAEEYAQALARLEDIAEISVVAAPGASIAGATGIDAVLPIHNALIAHADRPGALRFVVLDPPEGCSPTEIETLRSRVDSKSAALYYPWVTVANPLPDASTQPQLLLPPSGAVCGIYSRVDSTRGVFKSPANEAINGITGFERTLNDRDSNQLNPLGINCLRSFPGKGNLVWGARTISSDSEWKYVSVRRYLLYLQRSIDQGTQWAVFEPNNQNLWEEVRMSITRFLANEWQTGALLGSKPEDSFFVRCDQTTMTQDDLDNGRLICLIGVAPVRPAEFVLFRICQQTSEAGTSGG